MDILSFINYNPKDTRAKELLASKFNEVRLTDWISELSQDEKFKEKCAEFKIILKNFKENIEKIDFQDIFDDIYTTIKESLKNYPNKRFVDISMVLLQDPKFILCGIPPGNPQLIEITDTKVKYLNEYDYNFVVGATAQDVIDYLDNNIYRTSRDLALFTLDGEQIPSHEDVSSWMREHEYPQSAPIVVVPVDMISTGEGLFTEGSWEKGGGVASPYAPFFDKFRSSLIDIIGSYGELGVAPNNVRVSEFISPPSNSKVLSNKISALRVGRHFDVAESTLLSWHIEIAFKLDEKVR